MMISLIFLPCPIRKDDRVPHFGAFSFIEATDCVVSIKLKESKGISLFDILDKLTKMYYYNINKTGLRKIFLYFFM